MHEVVGKPGWIIICACAPLAAIRNGVNPVEQWCLHMSAFDWATVLYRLASEPTDDLVLYIVGLIDIHINHLL